MNRKPIALAVAGTLALAGSGFAMDAMAGGYMQDTAASQPAEGKCGEGKCGIDKMDADKDGKVSQAEFAAKHEGKEDQFARYDANGDGFIDAAEAEAKHETKGEDKAKMEGKCGEGKCGGAA